MKNLQNTYTTAQIGEKMRLIDFDTIKGLAQKVTVPLLPKYTKNEEAILNLTSDERILVASADGIIVGTSKLKKGAERNEMHTIYILPEFQGKGLGRALFAESLAWFDKNKDIQIDTAVYNYQAIKFYEGLGFVATGEIFTEEEFRMPSGGIIREQRMVRNTPLTD